MVWAWVGSEGAKDAVKVDHNKKSRRRSPRMRFCGFVLGELAGAAEAGALSQPSGSADSSITQEFIMYRLLPWWILGAPLVLALADWMRTPKPRRDGR